MELRCVFFEVEKIFVYKDLWNSKFSTIFIMTINYEGAVISQYSSPLPKSNH